MIMQDFFTLKLIFLRKIVNFLLKTTSIFIILSIVVNNNTILASNKYDINRPTGIEKLLDISKSIPIENIYWDMKVNEIISNSKIPKYIKSKGFKIGYCYFKYSIQIKIKNEPWEIWLCENQKNGRLYGISIEKGFNGIFFDNNKSKTKLFDMLFKKLNKIYGPPTKHWKECHNTRWNFTEQYSWYFEKTTISFVIRDVPLQQMAIHFHKPTGKKDYGPGICNVQPDDEK